MEERKAGVLSGLENRDGVHTSCGFDPHFLLCTESKHSQGTRLGC